jgi:hypothetical protein
MAAVNWYNELTHSNDLLINSLWQPISMFESSEDNNISEKAKAQFESERLNEWRKKMAEIRDKHYLSSQKKQQDF